MVLNCAYVCVDLLSDPLATDDEESASSESYESETEIEDDPSEAADVVAHLN